MTELYWDNNSFIPSSQEIYDFSCRGKKFIVSVCGSLEPIELISSFVFEKELREQWWDIKDGEIILDIGSSYGSYTLSALALGAKYVISVDPNRNCFFDLETNLILNGFKSNCLHLNLMVSDVGGIVDYYPQSHSNRVEGSPEFRVQTTVDLMVLDRVSKLDWIKIDVEGMEVLVLTGALKTIEKYRPKLLIENHVMFRENVLEDIEKLLVPLGYKQQSYVTKDDNWSLWS